MQHPGSREGSLAPGDVIDGRYRIERRMGDGIGVEVYRAEQLHLARPVVVEMFRCEARETREDFDRLARSLSALDHPGIVHVLEHGEHKGLSYIVHDYIAGRSLARVLEEDRSFPPDRAHALLSQLTDAVGYAHQAGIFHLELSPAQVIVTPEGKARIVDFGVARLRARARGNTASEPESDLKADLDALGRISEILIACEPAPVMSAGTREEAATIFDVLPPPGVIDERLKLIAEYRKLREKAAEQAPADHAPAAPSQSSSPNPVASVSATARPNPHARRALPVQRAHRAVWGPIERFEQLPPAERLRVIGLASIGLAALIIAGAYLGLRQPTRGAGVEEKAPKVGTRAPSSNSREAALRGPAGNSQRATNAAIAQDGRRLARSGQLDDAIEKLELAAVKPEGYGDPELHAALANAYARNGRGSDAAYHYWITARKEAKAITDEDLDQLLGLLALPKRDADRAVMVLRTIGPRAAAALRHRIGDASAPPEARRHAEEALAVVDGYSSS